MRRFFVALAVATVSCGAAAVLLAVQPTIVQDFENRLWDWRARSVADPNRANQNIKLIVVDQASLDFFESEYSLTWPFPRSVYSHLISFLTAGHARALAFDLLFTESSAQSVEGDEAFAASLQGELPVVNALSLENRDRPPDPEKLKLLVAKQAGSNDPPKGRARYDELQLQTFRSATLPIPELIERSSGLGTVHAVPDPDGVYRRYPLGGILETLRIPSLALALAEAAKAPIHLPQVSENGSAVVRLHGGAGTYQSIPLALVLQAQADLEAGLPPRLSPETFRDAFVVFGAAAPGLLDLRPTSLEERGNGSEFVAAALDNLIAGDFIREAGFGASIVISAGAIICTTAVAFSGWSFAVQALCIVALLSLFATAAVLSASSGWWIPTAVPMSCALLSAFCGTGIQYQLEGRRNRFLRRAFSQYVSPDIVDEIIKAPHAPSLGGEKRELTVFFSDIVGFTSISEKLDPETVVKILNRYLSLMSDVIHKHGGTVDKFVGDAVVAFWNAPLKSPDHALKGLRAAIECQQRLHDEAPDYMNEFGIEVKTRIGINTASVTVGNFGSSDRFNYTVIGDGVNLASRIEGTNKYFGTLLLCTKAAYDRANGAVQARRVGAVRVVGKEETIDLYEPATAANVACFQPGHDSAFAEALTVFEKGDYERAYEKFSALSDDPVAFAYCKRIAREMGDGGIATPVWEFHEK